MTASPTVDGTRSAIARLLQAIESRDLRAIGRSLSSDVRWQNVPHDVTRGRPAVVAMLGAIVTWSDAVRWDVVSASYEAGLARLERVDRFKIDGQWHEAACNGVFAVDSAECVSDVRDYVDLDEWRGRVGPALNGMRSRSARDVVRRHLDAVETGDAIAMAADYHLDASLRRGTDVHDGWNSIADYFDTLPSRLAGRSVEFLDSTEQGPGIVVVRWRIAGDGATASGYDTFEIDDGRIARQTVRLDGGDF